MRKAVTLIFGISMLLVNQVEAAPIAGWCEAQYDTGYLNTTQYLFSHDDIWNKAVVEADPTPTPTPVPEPVFKLSDNELYLLKAMTMAEVGYNQPDEGVVLVVDSILNRVESVKFPNTVTDVISQPPNHFQPYWDGRLAQVSEITDQVNRIVDHELMYGSSYPEVLYFTYAHYNKYCIPWKKVGDHYFGY